MTSFKKVILVSVLSSMAVFGIASDRAETLRAINMVENPTNQTGFGSKGELGPYQFRSATWRMYSKKPFRLATDRETADRVAVQHYEWLKGGLAAAGIDPNRYNIALAWNCGLSAVVKGRVPIQTYHYAERVNNLAEVYLQAEPKVEVVVSTTPTQLDSPSTFQLKGSKSSPEFKIEAEPFVFRVAGQIPQFVIANAAPRFVAN